MYYEQRLINLKEENTRITQELKIYTEHLEQFIH